MQHPHRWINPQFRIYWFRFFIQTSLIVIFVFLVMMALVYGRAKPMDVLSAIGASSIAASAFVVFALPAAPIGLPHRLFGSYVIAMLSGIVWHYLGCSIGTEHLAMSTPVRCLASALSAGTTMFLMAFFDFEHPPAMGLALGLVIDAWDDWTLFVVIVAVLVLCTIKLLIKRWFINLL